MERHLDQELGNYRLLRLLGSGGFADIYLGEHLHLGMQVALKVHRVRMAGSEREEFEREARTLAHLVHPHIVRVLDYGVQDNVPYLVMEYASGGTLRDRHPGGVVLELETVVRYVGQISEALQYAHNQKLVHRDVKPENMLLDAQERVLLSDFGIAIRAHSTRSLGTQDAIGTVAYMAPEQLRKRARPASDQYALATIVYEWLAGAPPFDGQPIQVALQHITEPVPALGERRPDLPRGVEQVVMRALSKEPERRFPSIQAFAEALEQATQGVEFANLSPEPLPVLEKHAAERMVASPPRMRGVERRSVLKFGLVAGGVLGLAFGSFELASHLMQPVSSPIVWPTVVSTASSSSVATAEATPTTGTQVTVAPGTVFSVRGVAWASDGRWYATGTAGGNVQVWNSAREQLWQKRLPKIWALVWEPAPAGQPRLAVACDDGKVLILNALTGQQLLVYQGHRGASVHALSWSPLGHGIASGDIRGGICVWDPENGSTTFTLTRKAPVVDLAWGGIYLVAASAQPGQEFDVWDTSSVTIAFTYQNTYGNPAGALTATAWSGGNLYYMLTGDAKGNVSLFSSTNCSCFTYSSTIHAHDAQINALSWAPDHKTFITASADGTMQTWMVVQSGTTGSVINEHLQQQRAYKNPTGRGISSVAWSPAGHILLFEDDAGNVQFQQV